MYNGDKHDVKAPNTCHKFILLHQRWDIEFFVTVNT